MSIFACGVSHQSAPITLRERLVFRPETLQDDVKALLALDSVKEVLILSTCNRIEMYCEADHVDSVLSWCAKRHGVSFDDVASHWFVHEEAAAVSHAMSVACGLESMVLGEPQILGQMKEAFVKASEVGAIGGQLSRLFQRVFSVAKKIRTNTAIGACPVSLASTTLTLVQRYYDNLRDKHLCILGAGDTAQLMAKRFASAGVGQLTIVNRTQHKAESLAQIVSGATMLFDNITQAVAASDIVIAATASMQPILSRQNIDTALHARRSSSLLVLDVGVPRNVDEHVHMLDGVDLYCIDDLRILINENRQNREYAAKKARDMIGEETKNYINWVQSLDVENTIVSYRQQVEKLRDAQLQEALSALKRGVPADEVVNQLAHALSNKLMHKPSVNMRKAGYDGRSDFLNLAQELLEI